MFDFKKQNGAEASIVAEVVEVEENLSQTTETISSNSENFLCSLTAHKVSIFWRQKCSSLFDFSCRIKYACLSWLVMFGLLMASSPTVLVLLWLLHQKGLFDPLYDWWEDHVLMDKQIFRDFWNETTEFHHPHIHHKRHYKQPAGHYKHDEKALIMNTSTTIQTGTVTITIIFTTLTGKNTNMGEIEVQHHRYIWKGRKVTMWGIIEAEKKGTR
ncbi:hypothetical protein RJ641_001207 [Dillenia turbinata]|uniref:Uncharacterized protein n=1 Tax=Dillenia turbinata TaxID=194707 RepID=A0AAN8WDC7_9MAGN